MACLNFLPTIIRTTQLFYLQNWCKIECGEEDKDWKIQEIPGKGLGIVALRDIPAKTRIMVDRAYTPDEAKNRPQVMDLHPLNGFFETKFKTNQVQNAVDVQPNDFLLEFVHDVTAH